MKKTGTILKVVLVIISIILFSAKLIDYFGYMYPIQHITKDLTTTKASQKKLDKDTTEVYCFYTGDIIPPQWIVIGQNGVLFDSYEDKAEEIVITGNTPNLLNECVYKSIFIFEGKYLGKKKYKNSDMGCYDKVFEVEKWSIKYPINRGEMSNIYTKKGFSFYDILDSYGVPSYKMKKNEFIDS